MTCLIINETRAPFDTVDDFFAGDTSVVIKRLRSGTPASVIPVMASRLGVTQDSLFDQLRLPRNTLADRLDKNAVLSSTEQERLYRAFRVWKRTLEVLEDQNCAQRWIIRENRSLGGEAPLALLDTEVGYELVLDTLGRIEYGVVA
ncbi:antitoxin Xre/MbcA/ParS toxin-binding domain-containing protein [Massilia sp. CCM 8734]|uniref:type II RES/Xre toxin-antitoxin system antitoxin n=1 Tax=Massilia sp. CCM 8734 TaxID=2609283 RepID=UPI001420A4A5|nr:antitoxin Xre/MbcA/ParS toxin-binding domain-containing protein [Massilia sp. CCM 8734]NHZ97357.1 DUF2384 domain-containing protein [Massilia sp. CCM 8734]